MKYRDLYAVANELEDLLGDLRQILVEEHGTNWVRGVDACLDQLPKTHSAGKADLLAQLQIVASTYRSMMRGYGSFSDFFIWREDFEERVRANERLDRIRQELWKIVEDLR